jgi:hypothetical protein
MDRTSAGDKLQARDRLDDDRQAILQPLRDDGYWRSSGGSDKIINVGRAVLLPSKGCWKIALILILKIHRQNCILPCQNEASCQDATLCIWMVLSRDK